MNNTQKISYWVGKYKIIDMHQLHNILLLIYLYLTGLIIPRIGWDEFI